jgi:hypothetical protein
MRFRSDPDKISTPDAHRGREFTPSGPDTCQSNPLGGGRDDQFRYTTSGHARLPFGLGKMLPILAKLYPCFSECIHHRSDGATLPARLLRVEWWW